MMLLSLFIRKPKKKSQNRGHGLAFSNMRSYLNTPHGHIMKKSIKNKNATSTMLVLLYY